jgi:hypothetical protein
MSIGRERRGFALVLAAPESSPSSAAQDRFGCRKALTRFRRACWGRVTAFHVPWADGRGGYFGSRVTCLGGMSLRVGCRGDADGEPRPGVQKWDINVTL